MVSARERLPCAAQFLSQQVCLCTTVLAATNKCLAQSNKSPHQGQATKKREINLSRMPTDAIRTAEGEEGRGMEFILFWIGFAVVVGVAANNRGRNGVGWGLLALIISPILAGLLLLALPRPAPADPLAGIATLAMIEATPEGSRSRQLLAEHQAKLAADELAARTLAEQRAERARNFRWGIVIAVLGLIVISQLFTALGVTSP
jgi:hypothetical protein